MRISIGADVCKKYDASFITTLNEIELLLPIDNRKVFEILTDWMSLSCDRGHSGKLIITRATTVALLQTIAMCSTALHSITHTVAYSSPAFEQTQVYSRAEPAARDRE